MTGTGISRRAAVAAACIIGALAVPSAAMALSIHVATTTTPNSNDQYVATAKCGAGQHVVSGGFKSSDIGDLLASHAVHGNGWTVHLGSTGALTLESYAYCSSKGAISAHKAVASAKAQPANNVVKSRCASGQSLVSGGFAFLNTPIGDDPSTTYRDYAPTTKQWSVMSVVNATPAQLAAYAYCERGVHITVRPSSDPVAAQSDGFTVTACHAGETLLGGGYTTTPKPDYGNFAGPDPFFTSSYMPGPRTWSVAYHNYGFVSGKITAFAYCTG